MEDKSIAGINRTIRVPSSALRVYEWCYPGSFTGFLIKVYQGLIKLLSPGRREDP